MKLDVVPEVASDESGEWASLGRQLRSADGETYDQAAEIVRQLVAKTSERRSGNRMQCGRLFGGTARRGKA